MAHRHPLNHTGSVVGGLIILVGVAFLLVQLEVIQSGDAWLYWPVLPMAFGLLMLVGRVELGQRVFGGILLLGGGAAQWYVLQHGQPDSAVIWPAVVILVGLHVVCTSLFRRRPPRSRVAASQLSEFTLFGSQESRCDHRALEGGEVTAVFGGCNVDLTEADLKDGEAVVDARAIFGGVEIRVPDTWSVSLKGMPIMGGFEDKTRPPRREEDQEEKRLVVTGFGLFGAVEIKN